MQHGHQFEFKRRVGIAYDAVPVSLKDVVIEPRDVSYTRLRSTFFRRGSPGIIIAVQSTQQVVEALAFARRHPQLPLSIRSGGHDLSGRSTNDGGILTLRTP